MSEMMISPNVGTYPMMPPELASVAAPIKQDIGLDHPKQGGDLAVEDVADGFSSLADVTSKLLDGAEKLPMDADQNEVASLAKLRRLKRDLDVTLNRNASLRASSPDSLFSGIGDDPSDLTAAAIEMKLVKLGLDMSKIIDEVLKGRLQSQKERNELINHLNELLNELRKYSKSEGGFSAADLDKGFQSAPAGSPAMIRLDQEIAEVNKVVEEKTAASRKTAEAYVSYALTDRFAIGINIGKQDPRVDRAYSAWKPDYVDCEKNGSLVLLNGQGVNPSKRWIIVQDKDHWPQKFKQCATEKEIAVTKRDLLVRRRESGMASVADTLLDYGIYKEGEKLPQRKEDLEAAMESITAKVNSVDSTQSLKMLDINKFNNGRNEAYEMAVKLNDRLIDSLNAIIRQLGER